MTSTITTWTRIEPRRRSLDVRPGLARTIADPAWLLCRQWQVGEFESSDGGTPLLVTATFTERMAARLHPGAVPVSGAHTNSVDYDASSRALDDAVERAAADPATPGGPRPSVAHAPLVELLYWGERFLDALAEQLEDAPGARDAWRAHLASAAGVGYDPGTPDTEQAGNAALSRAFSRAPLLDGGALYALIASELAGAPTLLDPSSPLVRTPEEASETTAAAIAWKAEVDARFPQAAPGAWDTERFGYAFGVSGAKGSSEVALQASGAGGAIEWHSFDRLPQGTSLGAPGSTGDWSEKTQAASLAPLRPPGSGHPRFWTMEDGRFAAARMDAHAMELAKAPFMEALMAMDPAWMIAPLEVRIGAIVTMAEQGAITLITTFGSVPVDLAGQGSSRPFSTAMVPGAWEAPPEDALLFLPPVAHARASGEPLELVRLARDEVQNVGWAIEERVLGVAGRSYARSSSWQQRRQNQPAPETSSTDALRYVLATPVPDYWYPLLPNAVRDANDLVTGVALTRGTILGVQGAQPEPESGFVGALPNDSVPGEEVWASGRELVLEDRSGRAPDGTTISWRARESSVSGSAGDAQLAFDALEPKQTEEAQDPAALLGGAKSVSERYPWSVYTTLSTLTQGEPLVTGGAPVVTAASVSGGGGTVRGGGHVVATGIADGAPGSLALDGSGAVVFEGVDAGYAHQLGIFTLVVVATRDPEPSPQARVLAGTSLRQGTAGVALVDNPSVGTLDAVFCSGSEVHTLTPSSDAFRGRRIAVVVLTCDGVNWTMYAGGEQIGQMAFDPAWRSSVVGGVLTAGNADADAGMGWRGAVGAFGIMPRALTAQEAAELSASLELKAQAPKDPWIWFDATDPLSMYHQRSPAPARAQVGQAVVALDNKGSAGGRFRRITSASSLGALTRASGGGVSFAPDAGGHELGFAIELPGPIQLGAFTIVFALEQGQAGEGTLLGLARELGGDAQEGIEVGVSADATSIVVRRDSVFEAVRVSEPLCTDGLGVMALRSPGNGVVELFAGASPTPVRAFAMPGASLEGTWSSPQLGSLRLVQRDGYVWGYVGAAGTLSRGRFEAESLTLSADFEDSGGAGRIEATLSGTTLTGTYGYGTGAPATAFTATLVDSEPPDLSQWSDVLVSVAPSFEGTWTSTYGELRLVQVDDVVWGDYGAVGVIEGIVDPVAGVLEGIYTNGTSRGRIQYTLTDFDRFEGLWGNNEPTINWDGTRTSTATPMLTAWGPPQVSASGPSFEGTWTSTFGELRLVQVDDVVWGDYANVGVIEGRVDPSTGVLEGTYTYGASDGRIRFTLEGDAFEGLWGSNVPSSNWDGTRTSAATPTLTQWSPTAPSFEGTFSSTFGELRLKQGGARVWGDDASVGTIEGTVDLSTGVLTGRFDRDDGSGGPVTFTRTAGGFTGQWALDPGPPSEAWDGTEISSAQPVLTQWPTDPAVALQASFEGTWSSAKGELRLKQGGTRVWGDVGDAGTLVGSVDRATNTLTGTYETPDESGSISFVWTQNTIEGLYGLGEDAPTLDWNASRTSSAMPTLTVWPPFTLPAQQVNFEGVWQTTSGTIRLRQYGDEVWGDFDGVGSIEATIDFVEGSLEGTYDNGAGESGVFRFTLAGYGRFEGVYAQGSSEPNLNWDGTWAGPTPASPRDTELTRVEEVYIGTAMRPGSSFKGQVRTLQVWSRYLDDVEVLSVIRAQ
ncbi:MAG: hypothetical protein AAGI01_03010 [Myxococcota bacterium]